jgi:lipoprotein-anchoring transpeptidase ErfK/SrfK
MKLNSIVLAAGLALTTALAGCSTSSRVNTFFSNNLTNNYTAQVDAGYQIPAVPVSRIPREFQRQIVRYKTQEKPGTIIVDTSSKHLYFVLPQGEAVRYGIGVGREGFEWKGDARIAMKREWPTWTPPREMIARQPELVKWQSGQPGGLRNPLGARALYLFNKGGDTGYRLHGTPEWASIGKAMSSGCIRLINQDIIDLYNRAEVGAKVVVL